LLINTYNYYKIWNYLLGELMPRRFEPESTGQLEQVEKPSVLGRLRAGAEALAEPVGATVIAGLLAFGADRAFLHLDTKPAACVDLTELVGTQSYSESSITQDQADIYNRTLIPAWRMYQRLQGQIGLQSTTRHFENAPSQYMLSTGMDKDGRGATMVVYGYGTDTQPDASNGISMELKLYEGLQKPSASVSLGHDENGYPIVEVSDESGATRSGTDPAILERAMPIIDQVLANLQDPICA
jgi:hypothetical protein